MVLKKKHKGFTLIELILTVTIILILTLIVVPNVIGYRHYANKKSIEANGRIILNAVEIYNAEKASSFDSDEIKDDMTVQEVLNKLEKEHGLINEDEIKEINKNISLEIDIKTIKKFIYENEEKFYCKEHKKLELRRECLN